MVPYAIFFLQTRIAIPQYFSQSYGAYFKYIVCTCAYTYCKYLRDVNDILRHIKIRAIWLAEMQSSFAEKKNRGPYFCNTELLLGTHKTAPSCVNYQRGQLKNTLNLHLI